MVVFRCSEKYASILFFQVSIRPSLFSASDIATKEEKTIAPPIKKREIYLIGILPINIKIIHVLKTIKAVERLAGIIKACEKRPIPIEKQESLVDKIEKQIQRRFEKEVDSKEVGELVMKHLYDLDEIAYVRFASVYRQFRDVSQFMKELKKFLR